MFPPFLPISLKRDLEKPKKGDLFVSMLMWQNRKALAVNVAIVIFLIVYTLFGGFVFLHFERGYQDFLRQNETRTKTRCIENVLMRNRQTIRVLREADFARVIAQKCLMEWHSDPKHEWSYKTAALYGFGILTTLGYGKIEPKTTNGRIFAVIYGFLGIPITVILLTNIGRYLESLAMRIRNVFARNKKTIDCNDSISTSTLFFIVVIYLMIGAIFIPLLNGKFDFFNGIYFAFICLTAIEYGDLVPHNNLFVPIVIVYVCIGLAISTIALDIGSMYVRKLHYIGQKLKNIANIKIWFGSKDLRISEFVSAVGQNIGIEQSVLSDIDLENLVKIAIQVKEGRLARVPQTHMIVEGIWPPELVPLFMKDGQFPSFVDQEDLQVKKKASVRFEDEIRSMESPSEPTSQQLSRLSPPPTNESSDRALRLTSGMTSSQLTSNSTSLRTDPKECETPEITPPPTPEDLIEGDDVVNRPLIDTPDNTESNLSETSSHHNSEPSNLDLLSQPIDKQTMTDPPFTPKTSDSPRISLFKAFKSKSPKKSKKRTEVVSEKEAVHEPDSQQTSEDHSAIEEMSRVYEPVATDQTPLNLNELEDIEDADA